MSKDIKILVVGGGSSGWMTAAFLSRTLVRAQITVIESSDIPIIGVGESTNRTMLYFQEALELDEKAFMRASNAAYKIAIRFAGFNRSGGVFYHPFGSPDRLEEFLFKPNAAARIKTYHVAEARNMFSKDCIYAYQLDAGLYGEYLKNECKRLNGVRHIVDNVLGVELTENGEIARIQTQKSGPLVADLYIDCSGFKSLLLGEALGEPFESYNKFLLNDKAIAARIPYVDKERELTTYTNCTALSAGWVWNIPLWSRIGTGYVYCSGFLSKEEAETEYREFLGNERVKDLQFNHLNIRTGRHARAWVGNCVGIGISYGFLEPLESTGLSLTQLSILDLTSTLLSGAPGHVQSDMFNRRQAEIFDATRDFVMAHFVLTTRDDTPYWRYIQYENALPDSLVNVLTGARNGSYEVIESQPNKFYQSLNWNMILSGMGVFGEQSEPRPSIDLSTLTIHARLLKEKVFGGDYEESFQDSSTRIAAHPTWYPTW
jgi:tryptophan halogenase